MALVVVLGVMVGVIETFNSDMEVLEEAVVECGTPMVIRIEAFSSRRRTPAPILQSQEPELGRQQ